jgi:hypothetical protein
LIRSIFTDSRSLMQLFGSASFTVNPPRQGEMPPIDKRRTGRDNRAIG